jgi:hypothetical protein
MLALVQWMRQRGTRESGAGPTAELPAPTACRIFDSCAKGRIYT